MTSRTILTIGTTKLDVTCSYIDRLLKIVSNKRKNLLYGCFTSFRSPFLPQVLGSSPVPPRLRLLLVSAGGGHRGGRVQAGLLVQGFQARKGSRVCADTQR